MSDPRATRAQWLRLRAKVRALTASLTAAEHALRRDARRSDDPDMATLAAQLVEHRQAFEMLGRELDARVARFKRECAVLEAAHVEAIVDAARVGTPSSVRTFR